MRRNKAKISGERVLVDISLSGQVISISGQTVSVDQLSLSGLNVVATVNTTVVTNISGQAVKVSGEAVKISGETVKAEISGQMVAISGVIDARISGETVVLAANSISGQRVRVSGDAVKISGEKVRISGELVAVSGVVRADISGQPVRISGEAVKISGETVKAEISGQTVSIDPASISGLNVVASVTLSDISGDSVRISGEAVKVSGETVKAEISGQRVNISGQHVVLTDGTESLDINTDTFIDYKPTNLNNFTATALVHGYDGASGWTRVRVRGSGQGFLLVDVSGQPVSISGQTVAIDPISISGLNVVAVTNVSGQAVRVSGEAVRISGETVIAKISGEKVLVSGQTVRIGDGGGGTNSAAVGDTTGDGTPVTTSVLVTRAYLHGFDGLSGWTRIRVRGSGDGVVLIAGEVSGTVISKVSGEAVQVSGQAVRISGETISIDPLSMSGLSVVTNISGQRVRISGDAVKISGEKVRISGELVAVSGVVRADVSGQPVRISGEAVQVSGQVVMIGEAGGSNVASIAADSIADGTHLLQPLLRVMSHLNGFDGASGWTRIRVRGSGDGVVLIAGEISGTVTSKISGETVQISGQTIAVSGEIRAKVSGEKVRISGEAVKISGEKVRISGETVYVDPVSISGLNVVGSFTASVSGQPVRISGEIVRVSGQVVYAMITDAGGSLQADVFDTAVSTVTEAVEVLGTASLTYGHMPSNTEWRRIGLATYAGNKLNAAVSGDAVKVSGETISVSGIVQPRLPTAIITSDEVVIASVSGGTSLGSGVVSSVTVRAHVSASGLFWVGGNTTGYYANSGRGLQLSRGDGVTMMIDNVNRIRVHAAVSGDRVSYIGQAY